jgi:predicted NACHT family NTPase
LLQLDSEAILKSIEAQHGLLVERARGIYSFSHLTFQEYFAAKWVTRSTPELTQSLTDLSARILENRYREVFLLSTCMLPEADNLLLSVKRQIDLLITQDTDLQNFLVWLVEKARSVEVSYSAGVVRSFYLALVLSLFRIRSRFTSLSLARALTKGTARSLSNSIQLELDLNLYHSLYLIHSRSRSLDLYRFLSRAIYDSEECFCEFTPELRFLETQLPNRNDYVALRNWWSEEGRKWRKSLREAMVKWRNIGHGWQFNKKQKEMLQKYYDANKLLVDCLNSDCYVTKATRQYIEDTLLLPMSEIEKIPVPSR